MKKVVLFLVLFLLGGLTLVSCEHKNATDMRENNESILDEMSLSSAMGIVSKNTLTVDYLGVQKQYKSIIITSDDSTLMEAVAVAFKEEYNSNNLLRPGATNFLLQFDGDVPSNIECDEFYLDRTGKSYYHTKNNLLKFSDIENSAVNIPIGIDSSTILNQSVSSDPMYRVIRIICEYEEETIAYLICFDIPHIKG